MLLVSGTWQNAETFKMIPLSVDCPFNEAIFVPGVNTLALVGKSVKDEFKRVPRLDDNGDPQTLRIASRANGSTIKEQRVILPAYYEYYIIKKEEIVDFVNSTAVNADSFDFEKFFLNPEVEMADLDSVGAEAAGVGKKSSLIIAP